MKDFSFVEREQNIESLSTEVFDLVIIGGGITGAGAARDAAMRGMKVALVEASDFASGTSSRSSKLVHGGIRYLENLEFKLVFEALNERTKLFEMTPHLVHPLRFMIPLYQNSRVGMFKMGLGMWLYDALALFQAPQMHERLSAEESLQRISLINGKDLCGSFVYSDAYMDDDRLVLETLRSAANHGACCVNYVEAIDYKKSEDTKKIVCKDTKTGKTFTVEGRHIISSVGPWTDLLGERVDKDWKKVLRPTKGIHLTFSRERLPLECAVVMAAEKSSRIVFAIPRHEMVIVGTTDTDYKGNPKDVEVTPADVEYLLKITNEYFPGAALSSSDIVASYAGVRPLVADGSENEGKTSREHAIWTNAELGITFVAGGKYTTYRLMAEQVVEESLKYFDVEKRVKFNSLNTAVPLNEWTGWEAYSQALDTCSHWRGGKLAPAEVKLLAERYGLEAKGLVELYGERLTYWQIEALQAIENTMCLGIVDFYSRRVPLILARLDHGLEFLEEVLTIFSYYFKWSEDRVKLEVTELSNYLEREFSWQESFKKK